MKSKAAEVKREAIMPLKFEELQNGAGNDIWGIDAELGVTVGYDSGAASADIEIPDSMDDDYEMLTAAEKVRLADMMIDRWVRYRAAVLAK